MIKKIYFLIFLCLLIISCGKKGDPTYNEKKSKLFSTKLKMV